MVSPSQLNQHIASYVDTGLKEAKLVPLRHLKSKVWWYFSFVWQSAHRQTRYCLPVPWTQSIAEIQPTFCLTSEVSMHWSILDWSYRNQAITAAIQTVWSHWINSWLGRQKLHCNSSQITLSDSLTNIVRYTLSFTIYIFWNDISLKHLAAACGLWRVGGRTRWTIIN